MSIKTVPHPPYRPNLTPCDICLFHKLRGCRYETIEEMKEAVTKVIDTLAQKHFHGAFQKLLERYKKCIAAREDYFEGDKSFMRVLSIKVGCPRGVMVKAMDCGIVVSEFVLQSCSYVHFRTNTLGKGMNPLKSNYSPSSYG